MSHLSFATRLVGFASARRTVPLELAAHRLMKPYEASGQFWLPDHPERAVWGKLRYEPGDAIQLILDGLLVSEHCYRIDLDLPEIHGRLYHGAPCVLRQVWGGVETFLVGDEDFSRTRLHASMLLLGVEATRAEAFYGGAITFTHLNDWFERPLKVEYTNNDVECVVRCQPARQKVTGTFRNAAFRLDIDCTRSIPFVADAERLEFAYQYKVVVLPETPQSLDWHLALTSLLRELFMFLIGTGIYTLDLEVFGGSKPWQERVYVYPRVSVPTLVRRDARYFYSDHESVKDQFQTLLTAWLANAQRLSVVRETLTDLLTVDGTSPAAVFTRVVQTMEHFHGLASSGEHRFVSRATWRGFIRWLNEHLPACWPEATEAQAEELRNAREPLVARMGHINTWSFRSRIRALFEAVPTSHLMPLIDNPSDAETFLCSFMPRLEATRNYLTHFDEALREKAFEDLETPTLQCWSVLIYSIAQFLGLSETLSARLAIAARKTLVLVRSGAQL